MNIIFDYIFDDLTFDKAIAVLGMVGIAALTIIAFI